MLDWACSTLGLAPELVAALERAAAAYAAAGHGAVTVTSGRRTLRRQAELMAAMTPAQLDTLYGRHGEPEYLPPLKALWAAIGGPPDPAAVYDVLAGRREGYISSHLYGAAVDLAVEGLANAACLTRLLEAEGFTVLDERDAGIPCLHATFRPCPPEIVRA